MFKKGIGVFIRSIVDAQMVQQSHAVSSLTNIRNFKHNLQGQFEFSIDQTPDNGMFTAEEGFTLNLNALINQVSGHVKK